jgi:hypothetical protein
MVQIVSHDVTVAQLVEHGTHKPRVAGSIPARDTRLTKKIELAIILVVSVSPPLIMKLQEVRLASQIETAGRDKYGKPSDNVRTYVHRAIEQLGVDNALVNDTDSAMYAWRLSHQTENLDVARQMLNMQGASLSELARAMADADPSVRHQIESDPKYRIPHPQVGGRFATSQ